MYIVGDGHGMDRAANRRELRHDRRVRYGTHMLKGLQRPQSANLLVGPRGVQYEGRSNTSHFPSFLARVIQHVGPNKTKTMVTFPGKRGCRLNISSTGNNLSP